MPPFNPVTIARRALAAVVFNTVLALAITAVSGETLAVNMVYSQFIGLLIWGLIDGGRFVLHPSGWPGARAMAGLVIGAVLVAYPLGSAIANVLLGRPLLIGLNHFPRATLGFVLMSLSAGGFGAYYFTSRELLARARLAGEEAQRQATEARLKLLESQLEPHMLFNTLANLRALIGTDPERAVAMLDRLNDYLRATLSASRADATAGQPHPGRRVRAAARLPRTHGRAHGPAPALHAGPARGPEPPAACRRCCCSRWWKTASATGWSPAWTAARSG